MSATSLNTYRRPWQILPQFKRDKLKLQNPLFPISTHTLALFIAFLAEKKFAASTVASYILALSYPHRLASLFDPTKSEMIQLALRGYGKLNPSADSRLPITLPILEDIILACEHTKSSLYSRKLIQAMYAIAFFAALRAHQPRQNIIAISQTVILKTRESAVSAIKLTLRNYKQSDASNPVDIFIYREQPVCPVSLLLEFAGTVSGTSILLAGCLSNISILLCVCFNRRPSVLQCECCSV